MKVKNISLKLSAIFVSYIGNFSLAQAQENPFAAVEDKTNDLIDFLSGSLGVAIGTLVVAIAGILFMAGKLQAMTAVRIGVGGIVVAAAPSIVGWLFG
jgi:type IV secretory pathway VirB2 component (pilin)